MSKKTVPESVPTFVHVSEKSNAATISQEVAHLLMDTVQRNNQIMENVSLELSAIGKNITENPADTMEEVRRVADVLLEYRK